MLGGVHGWNPPEQGVTEHRTSQRYFIGVVSREEEASGEGLVRKRRTVRFQVSF